jgi:hypothetical protein
MRLICAPNVIRISFSLSGKFVTFMAFLLSFGSNSDAVSLHEIQWIFYSLSLSFTHKNKHMQAHLKSFFYSPTVHLGIINVFYLPTVAQEICFKRNINSLNIKLNPICHLLALLGAHRILHISRIRVKIYIKTIPTCFGLITIIRERTLRACKIQ